LDELYDTSLSDYEDDETNLSPSGNNNLKNDPNSEKSKDSQKSEIQNRKNEETGKIEFRPRIKYELRKNEHFRQIEGSPAYIDSTRPEARFIFTNVFNCIQKSSKFHKKNSNFFRKYSSYEVFKNKNLNFFVRSFQKKIEDFFVFLKNRKRFFQFI